MSDGARVSYSGGYVSRSSGGGIGDGGSPPPPVAGPNFAVGQPVAYGKFVPVFSGHVRIPCENLWLKDALDYAAADKPLPLATWMVIAGMPLAPDIARVLVQVHANGNEVINTTSGLNTHDVDYAFYPGSTTQAQDPDHVEDKGADYTPAYRQRACLKFKLWPTEAYGGQIPAITATLKDTPGTTRLEVEELFKRYADFKGFDRDRLICEGLDGLEVDGMSTYEQDLSLKDFLALHCPLFGADYFERGDTIVVRGPSAEVTLTLDESELLPLDEDGAVLTELPDDQDLPDHLELTYYALEVGFQRVPVYARTRVANNPKWQRIACCLVITPQEAQTYVVNCLMRIHQSAVRHKVKLGPDRQEIEPGDIIEFTHKGRDYLTKVHAATLAADGVELELLNILTDESITAAGGFGGDPADPVLSGPPGDPLLAPVNLTVPIISGSAVEGQTATRSLGTWDNTPDSYTTQWYRNGVEIVGATAATYTYVTADVGENITVTVTATNAGGSATATSAPTVPVAAAPPDGVAPVILTAAALTVAEDVAFAVTLTADESVTWTKTGGPDAAHFTLTGALLEMTAKDFENPVDAGTNNTYRVQVTATDAAGNTANKNITVTVTNVLDSIPDAFSFTDVTSATISTVYTSAAITVSGIEDPAAITVSGGTYDINASGTFVSSAGTVSNGNTVRARVTSSGSAATAVNAVVTIGGVSDTYTVTTAAAGSTAALSTVVKHANITLSGSNLTATGSGAFHQCVVANNLVYSGEYEWDVTVGSLGTSNFLGIGAAHPHQAMNNYPETSAGIILINNGNVFRNSSNIASGVLGGFTAGDVIRVWISATPGSATSIKWKKNGGTWSSTYTFRHDAGTTVPAGPLLDMYDNCSATIAFSVTPVEGTATVFPGPVTSAGAHRYWRVYCGRNNGGTMPAGSHFSMSEIEMRIGGVDQTGSGTATATSENPGSWQVGLAFDNNTATAWASVSTGQNNSAWDHVITYDFGVGVTKALDAVAISARTDAAPTQTPTRWHVEFSDNGTTWTYAAATYSATSFTLGETRTLTIPQ